VGIVMGIMNIALKAAIFILQLILYPIKYVFTIIFIMTTCRKSKGLKFILVTINTFFLSIWLLVVIMFFNTIDRNTVTFLGGTTVALEEGGYFESYIPIYNGDLSGVTDTGSVNIGGNNYNINLDNLDSDVTIPSGMYQMGTVLQRAQLLLLVQEICSRPEITVTPQDLLGVFYVESSANMPSGSIVETVYPVSYNQYGCGGPMQMTNTQFEGTGINRGYSFISRIEDPSLEEGERAKRNDQSQGVPKKGGLTRPSMFYLPDAMYTMARMLSSAYPDSQGLSTTNWTKRVKEWSDENSLNSYQKDKLMMQSSYAYFNGYNVTQHTFIPAMLGDVMKKHGEIDQWSALSRGSLNTKLKDDLIPNLVRTLPDMRDSNPASLNTSYSSAVTGLNSSLKESVTYGFLAFNGGTYVYNGLIALAQQVGTENNNNQEISSGTGSYEKIVALSWSEAHKKFPRYDSGGPTKLDLIDVETGKEFSITRIVGTQHADVEATTKKDTAIMKELWGGTWSWTMRAVLIKDGKTLYAASLAGMPHAGEDSIPFSGANLDYIKGNNMNGVMDLHFRGSKTHSEGGVTQKVDSRHQVKIDVAEKAIKYLSSSSGGSAEVVGGLVTINGYARPYKGDRKITSEYGYRTDPINGTKTYHSGIDISMPVGTPLYATKEGKVVHDTWQNPKNQSAGGGLYVTITTKGKSEHIAYMHMSDIKVKNGQNVKQGQLIGYSGNTGRSTGPHLHYQIMPDLTYQNTSDPSFLFKDQKR